MILLFLHRQFHCTKQKPLLWFQVQSTATKQYYCKLFMPNIILKWAIITGDCRTSISINFELCRKKGEDMHSFEGGDSFMRQHCIAMTLLWLFCNLKAMKNFQGWKAPSQITVKPDIMNKFLTIYFEAIMHHLWNPLCAIVRSCVFQAACIIMHLFIADV